MKYNFSMRKLKNIARFIYRVDNFNRIIVFVSMCFFIVLPSMYLYYLNDENYTINVTMPSLLLLGLVLGNGLLVLYRPLRTTWLYFLINIIAFPFIHLAFDYDAVEVNLQHTAIFWVSYVYCILGFFINLYYLTKIFKRKSKSEMDERTNNDNAYDFLGGKKSNEAVSERLKELEGNSFISSATNKIKQAKFSRVFRIVSFFVVFVFMFLYFITTLTRNYITQNQLAVILIIGLLVLPISLVASLLYPVDFKYIYYFNGFLVLLLAIIACTRYEIRPVLLILSIIFLGLSFLVTLIVEGRTWTGGKPD